MWRLAGAILCALYLVRGAFGDSVMFHDCESEYDLIDVDISNCNMMYCVLTIGSEVNVSITAKATSKSGDVLDSTATITQMGIEVPQVVTPMDMCEASPFGCPIWNGADASFSAILKVSNMHSADSDCTLKWEVYDKTNLVLCMQTGVQLVRQSVND